MEDLNALVDLEERCFSTDRTTRRQFRHLLTRGNAAVLVVQAGSETPGEAGANRPEAGGARLPEDGDTPRPGDAVRLVGSVVVLFSRGTATARVYSIAVAPEARGRGIGRALLLAAERAAWSRERAWIRAEIRKDNQPSIRLFEGEGYRRFGEHVDYYEDHMDAWRYEKALDERVKPRLARVPYYPQTLDFTCGPAALMMGMRALDPGYRPDRTREIRIWREATTIFMTSGVGGCGPYGLALAAHRRGFGVEVVVSTRDVHMVETVRDPEKKEVMRLVQDDMEGELARLGVPIRSGRPGPAELERRFEKGEIPLVLISSWQIYETRTPHWVVVTGFDPHFVYVHDPFVDEAEGETTADSINMPIGREQFRRMARYGRRGLQAVVFLKKVA